MPLLLRQNLALSWPNGVNGAGGLMGGMPCVNDEVVSFLGERSECLCSDLVAVSFNVADSAES